MDLDITIKIPERRKIKASRRTIRLILWTDKQFSHEERFMIPHELQLILKKAVYEANWRYQDLSKSLGVTASSVGKWLNSTRRIKPKLFYALVTKIFDNIE